MMESLNQVLFRIVENEHDGRHLIALRDLSPGDLIFNESPTAFSPGSTEDTCIVCLKRMQDTVCSKCWWPVCSQKCQETSLHRDECRYLASCLASGEDSSLPIRHLLVLRCLLLKNNPRMWDRLLSLQGHHGIQSLIQNDEDFIMDPHYRDLAMFICNDCGLTNLGSDELSLIHTLVTSSCHNIMVEGREFPGLYITGALLTQSCIQNTRCVFKGRDNKLFLYAATDIKKGEKLTHSNMKNLVHTGTVERRRVLREMLIDCSCVRCSDQSEVGTLVSAVLCQRCEGTCLPQNPLDQDSPWECGMCGAGVSGDFVNTLLLSIMEEEVEEDEDAMSRYEAFMEKNKQILPKNHFLMSSEKAKYFLQFDAFTTDTMMKKIEAGKEILQLANILEPGLSVHRESILIHLGTCLQILIGDQMMKIYAGDDVDILSVDYIHEALMDARDYFEMALKSSILEDTLDGSKKTSTIKIRESLKILDDMKRDFEKLTFDI